MRTQAGRLIFSAAAIITLAVAAPRARAQGNGLQPSDYQRLRAAGQAEFSPDGKLLAYSVARYDTPGRPWGEIGRASCRERVYLCV